MLAIQESNAPVYDVVYGYSFTTQFKTVFVAIAGSAPGS
jgi:hypothetical protein